MKKRICLAAAIVLLGCLGVRTTLYAYDSETYPEQESPTTDDIMEGENQSRMFCLECSSMMMMQEICLPDSRKADGTTTHTYSVSGSSVKRTCTITQYTAWAGYYCDVCGNFIPFEDSEQPDGRARHYCVLKHSSCGKGEILMCPFGG